MNPRRMLEQPRTHPTLYVRYRIPQLLRHRLPLQGLDGVGVRLGGHDDECHDRHGGAGFLELVVEACGREGQQ